MIMISVRVKWSTSAKKLPEGISVESHWMEIYITVLTLRLRGVTAVKIPQGKL